MDHIKSHNVDLDNYPGVDEAIEYGMGSLFPKPGGLKEKMEYYLGAEASVIQVDGERRVYNYLSYFTGRINKQALPALLDILNCHDGCIYGTGTEFHRINNDDIAYQTILMRKKKYNAMKDQDQAALIDPGLRLARLNEIFKDLKLEDFMCEYEKDKIIYSRTVTDDEIESIFKNELMKITEDEKR